MWKVLELTSHGDKDVVIKESRLVELLVQMTCECDGHFDVVKREERGQQLKYYMQCRSCAGLRTFVNTDDTGLVDAVVEGEMVKGLNREHLATVLHSLVGGNTYSTYRYVLY